MAANFSLKKKSSTTKYNFIYTDHVTIHYDNYRPI